MVRFAAIFFIGSTFFQLNCRHCASVKRTFPYSSIISSIVMRKEPAKRSNDSKEIYRDLQEYSWPGNVRELQNVIERSLIIVETNDFSVDKSWFSDEFQSSPRVGPASRISTEQEQIEAALAQTKGRVSGSRGAAAILGIPASTLESKIRTLRIKKHAYKGNLTITRQAMSYSISTLLTRNLQDVFGENDPARRRAAIDEIYTEDCVFYDPSKGVYRGRDEIDRVAGAIKATHPDFRYQPIAEPEELGNGGRIQWVSGRPGEAPAYAGTDFIIARDGRIAALYLFFDKLP